MTIEAFGELRQSFSRAEAQIDATSCQGSRVPAARLAQHQLGVVYANHLAAFGKLSRALDCNARTDPI
jgi:hypothetical protein